MRVLFFAPMATPLIPSPGGGMRAVDDRPYENIAPHLGPLVLRGRSRDQRDWGS